MSDSSGGSAIHSGQRRAGPSIKVSSSAPPPTTASRVPSVSIPLASGRRTAGSASQARATAITITGTLIKKIGRQLRPNRLLSMMIPPSTGPRIPAAPPSRPKILITRKRSCGRYRTCIRERICGPIIAPLAPCAIRIATSISGLAASPQPADAAPNASSPLINSRR
ncbi:hypothetical protein SB00610_00914 [Klebsiella quasipneumoniae subsp. similipneumoniae]|nr:hypothetical protein SB00610_00914 [Klebsiella quasipneumoniae subsp. similipneumoniae]